MIKGVGLSSELPYIIAMMDVFTPNCLYCRYWLPAASCPKHVHGNQERWWWEPFYVIVPMPVYCILQAIVLHLPNDAWKHPKNRFLERLNYWINPTKIKLKWIQWFPCCLNWPVMQEISLLTDWHWLLSSFFSFSASQGNMVRDISRVSLLFKHTFSLSP